MEEISKLRKDFFLRSQSACGIFPDLVREQMPLVHLLTNYVTVTDCVNAVLALGGKAICSHAPEEAAQVTSGADALVCNLGGTEFYEAMEHAAAAALSHAIPLVIDPVGCAASDLRKAMCLHLTATYHPAAIRGNYAEIAALTEDTPADHQITRGGSRGLDSTGSLTSSETAQLKQHMAAFALRYDTILIASGETDLITDGTRWIEVTCGTAALRRITGAGCLSTAVLAAFLSSAAKAMTSGTAPGANQPAGRLLPIEAASSAVRFVGLAGEYALRACRETGTGAGHFHMYLFDMLSSPDPIWILPDPDA